MVDVDASFTTSLIPVVAITSGRGRLLSASFGTSLDAVADMKVARTLIISANFSTALNNFVTLGDAKVNERLVSASFSTALTGLATLTGVSDRRGKTVCDLVKESLSLWGFLCADNAPRYALDRAITDLNTALQMVWNNAEGNDFWSNETLTITLADTESSANLPDDVQNVVGPCCRSDNNRPLTPARTMGELETFSDLYLDGETTTEPLAYHVERMKQAGEDPAKCVLHVTPAVSGASVAFLLEVVKEAPRYTADDLTSCPLVPIPHRYAESLLVPIIRYHASSYFLFTATDPTQKETIDREYQQAKISLGLADPNPAKEIEKGGEK